MLGSGDFEKNIRKGKKGKDDGGKKTAGKKRVKIDPASFTTAKSLGIEPEATDFKIKKEPPKAGEPFDPDPYELKETKLANDEIDELYSKARDINERSQEEVPSYDISELKAEKEIENFSEFELELVKNYKKYTKGMLDFIEKSDHVGKYGFDKQDVEKVIAIEIERFWNIFSKEIVDENEFSSREKSERVFQMIKEELGKAQEDGMKEKKYGSVRAAAEHTIYKIETSPNLNYEDVNASKVEEGNQKFLDLTKKLWGDFSVHGGNPRINEKGEIQIPCSSDLDGESYLKILELAGFAVERSKVNFVKKGAMPEEGVIGDTSNKNGVISEEKGKRLIFDHHTPEAGRDTSTTKYAYETLVGMGLLKKESHLDKFVEFVTKVDNFDFTSDEEKKVYENYSKNIYGLCHKMKPQDILDLFEKGKDPFERLDDGYLKRYTYFNPAMKRDETLFQLAGYIEKKIKSGEAEIEKLEKMGFVVDTGDDRFGKILIDTKKRDDNNGNWYPKVDSENHSNQLAIRRKGYGGYLMWSQAENSFILYTNKRMDEDSVPGGFPQGEIMRGHMLVKGFSDPDPLRIKMEDIFSKLAGKKFEFEKNLEKKLDIEFKGKEMVGLIYKGNLTEDVLKKAAQDSNISLKRLLDEITSQLNHKVEKLIEEKVKELPKGKDAVPERNRIAMKILFEYQKTKNGNGKIPSQLAGAPPKQPPTPKTPEKFNMAKVEDELQKIKNDFGVGVQGDQIVSEDDNQKIISNLQEALGKVDKNELNGVIKIIALQKTTSGVIGNGDKISLNYTLPPQEMAEQLNKLIVEAKQKQAEVRIEQRKNNGFYDNQFIKDIQGKYPEFLANFEKQLDEQKVPQQAQLNLLEIMSGIKLPDRMLKKLSSAKYKLITKQHSKFPDEIDTIRINKKRELEICLGRDEENEFNKESLIEYFENAVTEL